MQVDLIALTQYLRGDHSTEALIEHAGRICYRSTGCGDPAAFIRARLDEGHESIIEHAGATFEVAGISRACSHQLVRHRLASYSQESQRYVAMSDPDSVIPPEIADDPEARALWDALMAQVVTTYEGLRARGIRKEDARFALPNATATRIIVTMNFREFLHVFRLRITPEAQWEIRQVALEMLRQLAPHAPTIFGDLLARIREAYPEFFMTGTAENVRAQNHPR